MYTVYKHTTPSGKVYIGITGRKPEYRWNNGNGYKENKHFYSAILKYGWENIEHEIVENGLTKQQACDLETELIAKYDATNPRNGYNNSIGGECGSLGVHPSTETRLKISESLNRAYLNPELRRKTSEAKKRAYLNNPELRLKISKARKGKRPSDECIRKAAEANRGKHPSDETRRKLSEAKKGKRPSDECIMKSVEAHRGKPLSDETKRKISMKLKGKPLSDETRKKMSEARKGKKVSEHVILAMTEATSKKVLCVETGEVYKSISEAGRQLGISFKAISNVCRGKSKTSGEYHWEYVEEPR